MLYLAAYQGLRAVEIAGLRGENVHNLDDPPHLVVLGKGNKERVLPLQPRVLAELQAYGLPRRGPVFTMYDNLGRRTTRPITPARVSAACGMYLAEAETAATLHAHFSATALYQTSQDLRLVQDAAPFISSGPASAPRRPLAAGCRRGGAPAVGLTACPRWRRRPEPSHPRSCWCRRPRR